MHVNGSNPATEEMCTRRKRYPKSVVVSTNAKSQHYRKHDARTLHSLRIPVSKSTIGINGNLASVASGPDFQNKSPRSWHWHGALKG